MVSGRGPKGSSVGVGPSVQHPTGMSDILFFFATGRFNSQGDKEKCSTFFAKRSKNDTVCPTS
jgi:hypothetical protein